VIEFAALALGRAAGIESRYGARRTEFDVVASRADILNLLAALPSRAPGRPSDPDCHP
jgi:hypothetical protein